jgi:hypothetical protein
MPAPGLGCVKTSWGSTHAFRLRECSVRGRIGVAAESDACISGLCPDCCDERLDANDVHDAGEIVGKDVQRHLGSDVR